MTVLWWSEGGKTDWLQCSKAVCDTKNNSGVYKLEAKCNNCKKNKNMIN